MSHRPATDETYQRGATWKPWQLVVLGVACALATLVHVCRDPLAAALKPALTLPPVESTLPPEERARKYYVDGVKAFAERDYAKAAEGFDLALKADPNFGAAHRALGVLYARAGNSERAVEAYRHYVKVQPDGADAALVLEFLSRYADKLKRGAN